MWKYILVPLFIGILVLSSCEKDIKFNLKNASDLLVVDASIENDVQPVVVLSKSLDYYSSFSLNQITKTFVHNADVYISNGTLTHKLKEYTYTVNGVTLYRYGIDSSNLATAFTGELNKKYTLKIKVQGVDYTAFTTIPKISKKPDSLWWKPAPFPPTPKDVVLMIKTTDPRGVGDYVRYFTKKNSEPFLPGENSVYDDQVIDGTTYQLQVDPGINRMIRTDPDSNYFRRGDTITMKLCTIDKRAYDFWSTWEFAYQSIGNPFAQPNNVKGNISNGALGAFYGYAAAFKTLIVPR